MHSVDDPNETAKKPAAPTFTNEERIIALLMDLRKRVGSMYARIDTLEMRFNFLERDVLRAIGGDRHPDAAAEGADIEPLTEPDSEPLAPPFALRSDGRILLSTHDLEGLDLSGRETFVAVVLSEAETADVMDRIEDAFHEAAAHSAAWLRKKGKKGGGSNE